MISGRQTLASLEGALGEARAKAADIEAQIASHSARLVELQQARIKDYRDLARVRMDLLAGGNLVEQIDAVEQQALTLIRRRESARQDLARRIQAVETDRKALEQARASQAAAIDEAVQAVDQAEARTQARLADDPAYRAQQERAQAAERTADQAAEKAKRSAEEQDAKGQSYRDDPLFQYLWERRFGLPEYRASGFIRWLDGKVAHLIGFADARANYARLNELPVRLQEHAERLQAAAEAEFAALKQLDLAAREADGIPAIEQRVSEEQAKLDTLDQRLTSIQADHQALLAEQVAFAFADDPDSRKAIDYLAAELQRDDLQALRRAALATPFPEDDLIVSRMTQREEERRQIESATRELREGLEQQRRRLNELEDLGNDFRRNRYDRSGSSFGNEALIALMLNNFLNGLLDRRGLWEVLQEQQRYQPPQSDPTFGSGGFGRGSVWGGGMGDLGSLGDIFGGRGGGFGQGGGGGHGNGAGGGGGFRTGGGF